MKAVVYEKYGPPEVLQVKEVATPVPQADEVLIKVYASTVAPSDCLMRSGTSIIGRLILGLRNPRPRYQILGTELAGEIEAVGSAVTRFKPGDQIYAFRGFGTGTNAEYKCMAETASVALKPANLSYAEAAAVVDGSTTALYFLKKGGIQPGQHILINGASGSIGTFAVQLAKHFGAEVTGVCSGKNAELVKSLGADHVIDYTQADFTQNSATYDIIFDTVGKSSFAAAKNALKADGRYLTTTGNLLVNYVMTWWTARRRKKFVFGMSVEKADALNFMRELVEAGTITPIIDRIYPMDQIAEAHRYVASGHKQGNVVLTVAEGTA